MSTEEPERTVDSELERLRGLDELDFDAATGVLEFEARMGDPIAARVLAEVDRVIREEGTF